MLSPRSVGLALTALVACAGRELAPVSAQSLPGSSELGLLGHEAFFVCASKIPGMNGRYVLSDEAAADPDTPVYVREDDVENAALLIDNDEDEDERHDFRLLRHNGFWMFADVASWPPQTHFRCDPTKKVIDDVDTFSACSVNLPSPPRAGYSPANPDHAVKHLVLQNEACRGHRQAAVNDEL